LAGSADKALALNARRGPASLLAQLLCFLNKAFKGSSLRETATLWHTLLHPFEDWRERAVAICPMKPERRYGHGMSERSRFLQDSRAWIA
jgi:hypothetical protein